MDYWFNRNAIYQVYLRSFSDDNGDGIGDINGLRNKLGYIKGGEKSLDIDAIWISPFYPSPMKDFGYDVVDYCSIDSTYGSLEDFDGLIHEAHERDIAVMIDIVPNHTSSEHPWFQEAISNPKSDKREYYIFKDGQDGKSPNNWLSVFGGSAWEPVKNQDGSTTYYLHSFLKEQPDLNWENPKVREEMKNILRFWFDRGVDGIRIDAVRWIAKDTQFRDDPINPNFVLGNDPYHTLLHVNSRFSPELDTYLRVITDVAIEYGNKLVIFEDHLDQLSSASDQIKRMYDIAPSVSAPFNFQGMHIPFSSRAFADMVTYYQSLLEPGDHAFYCLSNHDEKRLASRFGSLEARLLALFQLTMPGIPVIYYGQEIGMQDAELDYTHVQDPFEKMVPKLGLGRDPERTPMQWNDTKNAGFSVSDTPWLPSANNYKSINVEAEFEQYSSSLKLYVKLLSLRSSLKTLREGGYKTLHVSDKIFVYERYDESNSYIIVLNFSDENVEYPIQTNYEVVSSASMKDIVTKDSILHIEKYDGVIMKAII